MRRCSFLLAAVAALALALSPGLAEARAGGGMSMGSRGARTFSAPPATESAPFSAAPMQRSMTLPTTPSPGFGLGSPGYAAPMGARSPFMSGMLGGLIGAGLGGLLFGHGLFYGLNGFGSFLGFLLQIFLVVLVVRWLLRRFRGPQPIFAGFNGFARTMGAMGQRGPLAGGLYGGPRGGSGGGTPRGGPPLALSPSDYQEFERILKNVQAAWTANDLAGLRSLVTPEMLSYFAEQLSDLTSRGLRNRVTDVRLLKGDLSEAWREGGHDYATVSMRFSMVDVTVDATGRVVEGSPTEHVTATELWTFMRAGGGHWILSAIQQAR